MGLLNNLIGTGIDDPRFAATTQLAQGLLSSPRLMQGLAQGVGGYQQAIAQARQQKAVEEERQMRIQAQQMQLAKAKQEEAARQAQEAFRQSIPGPQFQLGQEALAANGGFKGATAALPKADPIQELLHGAMRTGLVDPIQYIQSQRKDTAPMITKAGDVARDPRTGAILWQNETADSQPSAVKEYLFAKNQGYQGTFEQFQLGQKRAGATQIGMPKIELKMGEGLASQVGPMAKDSRIQTQGAVKMFDAADRIEQALNSKKVTAGPMASQIQTVRQFVQVVGGGNDEGIRQTRQVIKSLAQMSVEARKQLQGQGQVTESEAAAVAKADSGDINDLTPGELRDLVTLTKRAAHYQAKSHGDLLANMASGQETGKLVPFYNVQGMEALLQHQPKLPQIGGGLNPAEQQELQRLRAQLGRKP